MIRSVSASPYVRTASKQATAHNTGAPSFCLSTLSPLQVPGYWLTGEATVGGRPVFLEVQGYSAGLLWVLAARLKYLVIAQSPNIWAVRPPSQSTHWPTREAGQLLPISVTLPAPATLHETPFVDDADGIYRDWELCGISTSFEG